MTTPTRERADEYERLNEIQDTYAPAMRAAYTRAVSRGTSVDRSFLEEAIASLVATTAVSTAASIGVAAPAMTAPIFVDTVNRLVSAYVNVIQPSEVRQAVALVLPPMNAVERSNRLDSTIFLDERSAVALERYRQELIRSDMPAQRVKDRIEERHRYYVVLRGNRLATTETNRAINAAITALAQYLNDSTVELEWLTRMDGKADVQCQQMDGTMVPVGKRFVTPVGLLEHPPLHPMGRCVLRIVRS